MFNIIKSGQGQTGFPGRWRYSYLVEFQGGTSLHLDALAQEFARRGLGQVVHTESEACCAGRVRCTIDLHSTRAKAEVDEAMDSYFNCLSHEVRVDNSLASAKGLFVALTAEQFGDAVLARIRRNLEFSEHALTDLIERPDVLRPETEIFMDARALVLAKIAALDEVTGRRFGEPESN